MDWSYSMIKEKLGCSKGTIAYHVGEGQAEKNQKRSREWKRKRAETKAQENDQSS